MGDFKIWKPLMISSLTPTHPPPQLPGIIVQNRLRNPNLHNQDQTGLEFESHILTESQKSTHSPFSLRVWESTEASNWK